VGAKGAKTSDFWTISRFKPLICQSVATNNPTKLAETVYFGVLQLSTKSQAKILTGTFDLGKKSQYPLGGREVFRLYFLP